MSTPKTDQLDTALTAGGALSVGFGLMAILAPRGFLRTFGVREDGATLRFMTRAWGTRTTLIGALMLSTEGDERRRVLIASTAVDVVDTVLALTAKGVPARSRVMAAATTTAFAALTGAGAASG